jgi:hypothetical protein
MIRDLWADRGQTVLRWAVGIMAILALTFLTYEFRRLIWQSGESGAIDLKQFYGWVHSWFAGRPTLSTYPPASFVILWPLVGWLPLAAARWLWAVSTVAALGWLSLLVVRESGASTRLERVFVALLPLSMYATAFTIGGGRLIVHQLPLLMAGVLALRRQPVRWRTDLLAAFLIVLALVKPSVAAPFFWLVLFVPGRLRPALLVVGGYVAATLGAASFQSGGAIPALREWLTIGVGMSQQAASEFDTASVHTLLGALGLQRWDTVASLLLLAALGLWVYLYRRKDIWLLLGVTALVARFWTYHQAYDDLLLLLPMVALFRCACTSALDTDRTAAGLLFVCTLLSTLTPGGRFLPGPAYTVYAAGQVVVWLVTLVSLGLYWVRLAPDPAKAVQRSAAVTIGGVQ